MDNVHFGRSFYPDHWLEDDCPCPKEDCGLVAFDKVVDECEQHPLGRCKTIRQSHKEEDCPGIDLLRLS